MNALKSDRSIDRPFSSARQAAAFGALLLVLLISPWVLTKSGLISRRHLYSTSSIDWGVFPHIHRQIFEEHSDIDILVLGASLMYQSIDSSHLEDALGSALGRRARVITLGTNWRCEMELYILLRDMLKHRKVGMVLVSMPIAAQGEELPHVQAYQWVLPGESDLKLEALGTKYELSNYAASVLGTPRHLLSLVRSDLLDPSPRSPVRNGDLFDRTDEHGSLKMERGLMPDPYVRWDAPAPNLPPESIIYSEKNRARFRFAGPPLNRFQHHFLQLFFDKLAGEKVPVAVVNIPLWEERSSPVVEERMDWSRLFHRDITLIGVPPTQLFSGMTETQVRRLFYTSLKVRLPHLNRNGNEYFTRAIAPAVVATYVQHSPKKP